MNNSKKYLTDDVNNFVTSLQKQENNNYYLPAKKGVTELGKSLNLGFSNFAVKIFFTTNRWKEIDMDKKINWVNDINEFQVRLKQFPINSFVDKPLVDFYNHPSLSKLLKRYLKKNLQFLKNINYESVQIEIEKSVRAETKQAISTLYQIGESNKEKYLDFPHSEIETKEFIDGFNWNFPWNAGAHFASLCVFSKTQLDDLDFAQSKFIFICLFV
jgi:hypothetical protein